MKTNVLVVEDDDGIARLIRFILEGEGYEVHWAADGRAALECLERIAPPALVTLDIMLPYVMGPEVLARLRGTPGWEHVPVLVLSARPGGAATGGSACDGADGYLMKPFKPDELRLLARRLAGARPRLRGG